MNVNPVSFGAYTDNGNKYERTSAAKITGAVIGAGVGAYGMYRAANSKFITKQLPLIRKIAKYSTIGISILATAGIGMAIGKLVDAVVNKHRQNKADKAAENKPKAQDK